MKALARYTAVTTLIATLLVAATAPFVGDSGKAGLLLAAGVAVSMQVLLFGLLHGARRDSSRFLAFWGVGVLARMGVVVLVGVSVRALDVFDPTVTVMGTVGLLFIFLLLEPLFLLRSERDPGYAR